MAILTGVFTTVGRGALGKSFGNLAGLSGSYPICRASYFRIGMGGYTIVGGNKFPKAPDPSLTALEATGAPGDFYFQKSLANQDISWIAPSTLVIRCRLDPIESNDDGTGNPPKFFEIGIFDENNVMIIYSTFAEQTKSSNKILTNNIQAYF